ncbi:hypothetical protein ACIBBD_15955 [Streptomyces sp. NPDC051315]|uniref:hypothetical protein n=1 Tax=Streptomyces sp. NPDC051315 TaxID=3365650 RepID=UPI0037B31007
MFMRLCTPVSLCLAAAAVFLPAPAYAEAGPSCAGPDAGDFPLTTRLHGGPGSYRAGGGYGTWYLDLTNTTGSTCAGVHPVVVLVDAERSLKPAQPRLEFYADGRPHPVHFETTDEDELVGVLTGGVIEEAEGTPPAPFPGFTVPPGRTLTVKLRLALTSDAAPNEVTANAAVVQRHGDDGEWVGQSNDYRFTVEAPARPATPAPDPEADPEPSASAPATGLPYLAEEARELATTGLTSPAGVLTAAACLLTAGAVLLLARRRR